MLQNLLPNSLVNHDSDIFTTTNSQKSKVMDNVINLKISYHLENYKPVNRHLGFQQQITYEGVSLGSVEQIWW